MRVFAIGYPSLYGGADTELWHTIKLWRRFGVEVLVLPTWQPNQQQQTLLSSIGVRTVSAGGPNELASVPDLAGSIVVSFCNGEFLKHAHQFRELGCRLVWANCMTWLFPAEKTFHENHGPFDAYLFQSSFQRQSLAPFYRQHGAEDGQFHLIHGCFDAAEFPFAPRSHRREEEFVIGRIARDDLDKWSSNLWPIYRAVCYAKKKARVMAWSSRLQEKCGTPPEWAETLAARAEPACQFLSSLHSLLPVNGGAQENWPRAGLEAMASGVPVVAQRQWGWCEMIDHGVTGFLGQDDDELAHFTALLAHDETLRMEIATAARRKLEDVLANPHALWQKWKHLFESLDGAS